jgi:hypothetical protein
MPLISYMKTATNKRLIISESHDNSNRCTSCRGKPDQHDTYASYRRPSYVASFHESSTELHIVTTPDKKGLPTQSTARRLTDPWVHTQFLSRANQWSSGESQISIDSRLLGLPGPYHRYAIGMFNTCSRGPTHRSSTDTGRGLQP